MKIKLYGHEYPSATEFLINEKVVFPPKQWDRSNLRWAEGIDIEIPFRDVGPRRFEKYKDQILLMAYQEAMRYNEVKWKFGSFEVRLSRKGAKKDIPDIASFQAAMHGNPEILVYGEEALGYEVPQKHFLNNKLNDIIEIAQRYGDKVDQQNPYKVLKLIISVREPKFESTPAGGYGPGMPGLPMWPELQRRDAEKKKIAEEKATGIQKEKEDRKTSRKVKEKDTE